MYQTSIDPVPSASKATALTTDQLAEGVYLDLL
jgi:hypothetical protein